MNFKIKRNLKLLNNEEIEKEIIITKQQLFRLRFKKATHQSFQWYSFIHLRYKLRFLLMLQNSKNPKTKKRRKKLIIKKNKLITT